MQLPEGWKVISVEPDETGLKVTLSIPSDTMLSDIERWDNEGGFQLSVDPVPATPERGPALLPYTQEEIQRMLRDAKEQLDAEASHAWKYSSYAVECIFCHASKGSPASLRPCGFGL